MYNTEHKRSKILAENTMTFNVLQFSDSGPPILNLTDCS